MSTPLKYDRNLIELLCKNIEEGTGSVKIDGKKITLTSEIEFESKKASILFSPMAYEKQRALIDHCQKEVGWHGFIHRDPNDDSVFIVEDISVYPQEVTGSEIKPDQREYEAWKESLDDDHFNACLYHGHSHVNMGVFASPTDTKYQHDVLSGLAADSFLVFMIWNKRGEKWAKIYDKRHNCVYNENEITVGVVGDGGMDQFLAEADKLVREYKYTPPAAIQANARTETLADTVDVNDAGQLILSCGYFDKNGLWCWHPKIEAKMKQKGAKK